MTRSASLIVGLFLCCVSTVLGQISLGTGSIEGTVLDAGGAAVPHAEISVKNVNTGQVRSSPTDASGRYTVLSLLTGRYEVQVSAVGFKSIVRTGINIEIGTNALVDFSLSVGSVTTEVTVTTAPPLIESSNATIGQVIENKDVVSLPLNGRSYTQLAVLAPGVAFGGTTVGSTLQSPSLGANGSFSISGARAEGSEFTLNGITVTNEFTGGTYAYPPIDSIQEFKLLQSNYGAEFGFRVGQVVVTSTAGTNAFHGSAYEFIRNDVLDAANFFNNLAGIG
jgi:Carboxypeptidase regulatory-like domain